MFVLTYFILEWPLPYCLLALVVEMYVLWPRTVDTPERPHDVPEFEYKLTYDVVQVNELKRIGSDTTR